MVYRRRLWRKKPAVRRRRPVYRRRVPRPVVGSTYRFKRLAQMVRIYHRAGDAANIWYIDDASSILNPAYGSGAAWPVEALTSTYQNQISCRHNLAQLEASSDFTNLYDRYKITGVKATFLYQTTEAPAGGAMVMPTILYAADYDDDSPPTYSLMRQKQNVKQRILTGNKPFSIFYKPRVPINVSNAGVNTAGFLTRGWLNSNLANVPHYGMKFSLNNLYSSTTTTCQLEVKFTYYLQFKDPQ